MIHQFNSPVQFNTSAPPLPSSAPPLSPGTFLQTVYQQFEKPILGWITFFLFLALWELAPALGWVEPLFTSSPSRIFYAAQWLFAHGFWYDIRVSSLEFVSGFGLALLVGVPVGIALGWYHQLQTMFHPLITLLHVTPRVALLPLLILWLGIGLESKIALIFLSAVFSILLNVTAGMRSLDEQLLRCARGFGATNRQIFLTIALPSIVPLLLTGLKLAVGRALVGLLVGELVASQAGIGHMMVLAGSTFQIDKVFVGVVLLAGVGWGLTTLLERLERHLTRWHPESSVAE